MAKIVEIYPSGWMQKRVWPTIEPEKHHIDWFHCVINGVKTNFANISLQDYFNIYCSMVLNSTERYTTNKFRDQAAYIQHGEVRINLNDVYFTNRDKSNRHIHMRTRPLHGETYAVGTEISHYIDEGWKIINAASIFFYDNREKFITWAQGYAQTYNIILDSTWTVILRPSANIPLDVVTEIYNVFSDSSLPPYITGGMITDWIEEKKKTSWLLSVLLLFYSRLCSILGIKS